MIGRWGYWLSVSSRPRRFAIFFSTLRLLDIKEPSRANRRPTRVWRALHRQGELAALGKLPLSRDPVDGDDRRLVAHHAPARLQSDLRLSRLRPRPGRRPAQRTPRAAAGGADQPGAGHGRFRPALRARLAPP